MASPKRLQVRLVAGPREEAAIRRAAERLGESLDTDGQGVWPVDCVSLDSLDSLDALDRSGEPSILVTSLLPELAALDEPWSETERRLRERYSRLGRDTGRVVYLCTVFRHIDPDQAPAVATKLRVRIRRLNRLAVELSRETGVFVIDLDRAFADVGGRSLQTDYRLRGPRALEAAADCIATTLLATGLDAWAPVEVQSAAAARLEGSKAFAKDFLRRHRIPTASYATFTRASFDPASVRETAARLVRLVSRRGLRHSAAAIVSGLGRLMSSGATERRS